MIGAAGGKRRGRRGPERNPREGDVGGVRGTEQKGPLGVPAAQQSRRGRGDAGFYAERRWSTMPDRARLGGAKPNKATHRQRFHRRSILALLYLSSLCNETPCQIKPAHGTSHFKTYIYRASIDSHRHLCTDALRPLRKFSRSTKPQFYSVYIAQYVVAFIVSKGYHYLHHPQSAHYVR